MSIPTGVSLDAYDTLAMRLSQARGVLAALEANYTEQPTENMNHILTGNTMLGVLSALSELIDQAIAASEGLREK